MVWIIGPYYIKKDVASGMWWRPARNPAVDGGIWMAGRTKGRGKGARQSGLPRGMRR